MNTIDEYLENNATPVQKQALNHIRSYASSLIPDVEETISYGIPTLNYKGKYVIYFAAFKNHMSVFPGGTMAEDLSSQLEGYKIAKGTIRFTEDKPLPDSIIKYIVANRLNQLIKS